MNVVELKKVRRRYKKEYLARNKREIKEFIDDLFLGDLAHDFSLLRDYYESRVWEMSPQGSDYWHLRDILADCFSGLFAGKIEARLQEKTWFNSQWLSQDDFVHALVNEFIEHMESNKIKQRKWLRQHIQIT